MTEPKLYRVDPSTGETMDEIYHLKQGLAKHHAVWGGVCARCQRTYPCLPSKTLRDALNALKSQRRMKVLADAGVSGGDVWRKKQWKRSDISSPILLACVQAYGMRAYEVLCETYPWKVVYAAFLRDCDRGYLGCGTSSIRCWLESDGEALIRSERNKVIC